MWVMWDRMEPDIVHVICRKTLALSGEDFGGYVGGWWACTHTHSVQGGYAHNRTVRQGGIRSAWAFAVHGPWRMVRGAWCLLWVLGGITLCHSSVSLGGPIWHIVQCCSRLGLVLELLH